MEQALISTVSEPKNPEKEGCLPDSLHSQGCLFTPRSKLETQLSAAAFDSEGTG